MRYVIRFRLGSLSVLAVVLAVGAWQPLCARAQPPAAPSPSSDEADADTGGDEVDALDLEEIVNEADLAIPDVVVTGARVEQSAASAAVATEVIRREEIESSGARDVAELLEERSGLQVQRSFRGTELWLRGLDPEYTLVLVDGDRAIGRSGGAIDLSRYGVEMLERVEIVRGPSSALYGSDAIGGVVNLITRESDRDFEAALLASYGLGNVIDVTALVAGRPDPNVRLRVSGGFHFADPFRRAPDDDDADDDDASDDEGEVTAGSARLQWSLGARGDIRPDSRHRLLAQADYMSLTLSGVDAGAGSALFDRTQQQEQLQASITHQIRGSDGLRLQTRVSYSQFREQYLNDQRGSAQLDSYEDNREHIGQLSTVLHFVISEAGAHGVTLGFEELFQSLDSERLVQLGRRSRFSVFAQDEWLVHEDGDTSFTVVPGVRLDVDSQFGDQLSPKLAARFDPVRQLVIRASYGRGFRAPSFQQLLLRFENPTVGYVVSGNPSLGAESAHSIDAGFEWTPVREIAIAAAFFRNDLENMIATVTALDPSATGTLFTYENLTSAWTMGLESSLRLRVERWLTVTAGYTLTETWDGQNERRLEGRALHRMTLAGRVVYEPWELELTVRGALQLDRVYYVDTGGDGIDDELYAGPLAQIDLRLAKSFDRTLELFVGVDNLLDAGDAYSVLRPFTVYGGARVRY